MSYVSFRYFWSYEQEKKAVISAQEEEVSRVKTVFDFQTSFMGSLIRDYASWGSMRDFVVSPSEQFISDNFTPYIFQSIGIDALYVYDEDVQKIWSYAQDLKTGLPLKLNTLRYRHGEILAETLKDRSPNPEPVVGLITIDKEPYLFSSTRICNSKGQQCNAGYMLMLKKIRAEFQDDIQRLTGLNVHIRSTRTAKKMDYVVKRPTNIERVVIPDYRGRSAIELEVRHNAVMPPFASKIELIGICILAVILLMVNFFVVNILISPLRKAALRLQYFKDHGGLVPKIDQFYTAELRSFALSISDLLNHLEQQKEQLLYLSEHDPLTGLANRRKLDQTLDKVLLNDSKHYVALFLLDVDRFKAYNDNYGHTKGDEALSRIAKAIDALCKQQGGFSARFGGEEFCILFSSQTQVDIVSLAKQICQAVVDQHIIHQYSHVADVVSVSVGGVRIKKRAEEQTINKLELFNLADKALYQAKEKGRNGYIIVDY
ncbi:diguanylate cyclase [Vibrio sp. Of7-15]|uniref:sensor domain-containing diguanylate cyclase n=1 Tax=Vibrio sp. Of7-15 TaxID=2724879 RepID=UPI001EF2006A|nr:diguanylate cyclase [Vibrio sp. Of7-15]MCG7496177.1 diguanylate cyclase [Vibrio sp. Of7-15]